MRTRQPSDQLATVNPARFVREKLSQQPEIRPFPAAVAQLMAAMQEPNYSSATLAKIIECDPALAVRLLKMANSPLYGLSNEVRSIAHATSLLGARTLRTLAMSVAGAAMFSSGSTAVVERERLWLHSLGAAAVACAFAELDSKVSADDAFLACVFHDVGKLFLFDVIPEVYVEITKSHVNEALVEQEQLVFELNHAEIGLQSANAWKLSEQLKVAIGYHHRPTDAPAHFELTGIVYLANKLARAWGIGSQQKAEFEWVKEDVILQQLDFELDVLAIVKERAEAAFVATQEFCA